MNFGVFVDSLKTINQQMESDHVMNFIRKLNDRDLKLFMKYLYQNGFQDCADLKRMDSDKAIRELVEEFNKW